MYNKKILLSSITLTHHHENAEDPFMYALSSNSAWAGYKGHQNPEFFTRLASGQAPDIRTLFLFYQLFWSPPPSPPFSHFSNTSIFLDVIYHTHHVIRRRLRSGQARLGDLGTPQQPWTPRPLGWTPTLNCLGIFWGYGESHARARHC